VQSPLGLLLTPSTALFPASSESGGFPLERPTRSALEKTTNVGPERLVIGFLPAWALESCRPASVDPGDACRVRLVPGGFEQKPLGSDRPKMLGD